MRTEDLQQKHEKYVAGASTFSKSIYRFPEQYPHYITKAKGCQVWDTNGDKYIDYVSALGAITLGYNNEQVNCAVKNQIDKGNLFSLCSDIEAECAEFLTKETRTEKCLFVKSGTDATNAAVRLAKAYTGKDTILICNGHYHGWGDWFGIIQDIHKGVDDMLWWDIRPFEYNNLDSMKKLFDEDEVAAVIMEPVTYETPNENYLKEVEKLTHDYGSLLIMDEIVTYPRFPSYSLYHHEEGINADISCIGKGIGNGYSISAVVGREDILDQRTNEEVFISGTFFGEAIGMTASMKTLEIARKSNLIQHIWHQGHDLKDKFNKLCQEKSLHIEMIGLPPRMTIKYPDNNIKSLFLQETARYGLLLGNIIYPTLSHTGETTQQSLNICEEALNTVALAIEQNRVADTILGRKCRDLQLRKSV